MSVSLVALADAGLVSSRFIDLYTKLSLDGKKVFWTVLESTMGGRQLSNREIAKMTGMTVRDVQHIRLEEKFADALTVGVREVVRGSAELGLFALRQKVSEGNMTAIKLWLEITGVYSPIHRTESKHLHVRVDASSDRMPSDVQRDVVERWKGMGWTKEEFLELWEIVRNGHIE